MSDLPPVVVIDTPLIDAAAELVTSTGLASVSFVARKLDVTFREAEALMDALEARGIVGPRDGTRARDVLLPSVNIDRAMTLYTLLNQADAGVARGDGPELIHNLLHQAMDVLTGVAV